MKKKKVEPKLFQVKVLQEAKGGYEGFFTIEAKNMKEAQKILDNMTLDEIDEAVVDWEETDYMEGIVETTKVESIQKL